MKSLPSCGGLLGAGRNEWTTRHDRLITVLFDIGSHKVINTQLASIKGVEASISYNAHDRQSPVFDTIATCDPLGPNDLYIHLVGWVKV